MRSRFLAFGLLAASAVGCTNASEDDDAAGDEQAIAAYAIGGLRAIAPPEHRVATRGVTALLGGAIEEGHRVAVIRALSFRGKDARLVVDEQSLATSVIDADVLAAGAALSDTDASSVYAKSLASVAASGRALSSVAASADDGGAAEPFALTIDMCQSRKPWDRRLFEWAVNLSERVGHPVPVGIAMTGGWAKAHSSELDQLVAWERADKLAITWINHSSTHPLHCLDSSCGSAEFLTASSVDFDEEVLGLERTLLERGLVPAPIFRFPGLVHDAQRLDQLERFSLLPLDADAWIAKGQPIKPRAVVLVHGNGNEPPGIVEFLRQVESPSRAAALRSGKSALVSPLFVAPGF